MKQAMQARTVEFGETYKLSCRCDLGAGFQVTRRPEGGCVVLYQYVHQLIAPGNARRRGRGHGRRRGADPGEVDHTGVHRVHAREHGDDVPRHPGRNVAAVVRAVRAAIAILVDSPQPFVNMI